MNRNFNYYNGLGVIVNNPVMTFTYDIGSEFGKKKRSIILNELLVILYLDVKVTDKEFESFEKMISSGLESDLDLVEAILELRR